MRKLIIITLLMAASWEFLQAQNRTLTFTSVTDAKFFVYLNGRLQNERSTGMITLRNLEDKEYHVRIVIDDPFEVAATQRIRPDESGSEYTVRFNAVRERVYLKRTSNSTRQEEDGSETQSDQNTATVSNPGPSTTRKRTTIRRNEFQDSATERIVNTLKTKIDNP